MKLYGIYHIDENEVWLLGMNNDKALLFDTSEIAENFLKTNNFVDKDKKFFVAPTEITINKRDFDLYNLGK
jgi:hypothetical protein